MSYRSSDPLSPELSPGDQIERISVHELRRAFQDTDEIAVVDARDAGVHARDGHILRSVSMPLSTLEIRAARIIPRRNTRVVVYDDGSDTHSVPAAKRLMSSGYSRVLVLEGGASAWRSAGYELFTGINVIGKAFGEHAEHRYGTPHVSVRQFQARRGAGENIVLIDSRTEEEFRSFSIPGAVDLPGAEIVFRFYEVVKDPDAHVVVNCGGRTRSIIGAQALINAGVPNPVSSLANGTMDWLLEGFDLQPGSAPLPPRPEGEALAAALDGAARLVERFEIKFIDETTLARFRGEENERSLYLLDVRTHAEFKRGHYPGACWAEGGQLVQQVGEWIGTQNARIVLLDDADSIRATNTASWLVQINWGEVYILRQKLEAPVELGEQATLVATSLPVVDYISPCELKALGEALILDIENSNSYRKAHIPGSRFAIRSRLSQELSLMSETRPLVLTSADGVLAAFGAAEVVRLIGRRVLVLAGGTNAWRDQGHELESGDGDSIHPFEDVWLTPYQVADPHPAFREYLAWELGLVEQLKRDGTARFREFA